MDKRGAPLPRVLVNAEERVTAGSITDPALQTATQAQSGDDGSFSLDHVPQGTVFVRGYDGDYAVTTLTVKVGDCAKLRAGVQAHHVERAAPRSPARRAGPTASPSPARWSPSPIGPSAT